MQNIPELADIPGAVREELATFLDQRREQVAEIGAPVTKAVSFLESFVLDGGKRVRPCLLYTSPSPRDVEESRMPSSA